MLISYAAESNPGNKFSNTQGSTTGSDMTGTATLALKDAECNKALFTFRIECSELVSDVELEELLKLSGVTTDGFAVPPVSELKSADGTADNKKITIQGTEKFFKASEAVDKSELVRFKLKNTYESAVGQGIKTAVQPVVDAINNNGDSLSEKYWLIDLYISDTYDADNEGAWTYLATHGGDNITELAGLLDKAITAGDACYAINNNSDVNNWLNAAKDFQTAYNSASDNKGKLSNLGIGLNRAFMACAKSIILLGAAKGYTESDFTANYSDYSYLKNDSTEDITAWNVEAEYCSTKIGWYDLKGMVNILDQGNTKGVFDGVSDIALDASPLTEAEEGLQTADTFKVYQITGGSQSKLYLANDAANHKKILTFEIPLDLPECKSVTENGNTETKTITSFMVYTDAKHEILENGYLASKK